MENLFTKKVLLYFETEESMDPFCGSGTTGVEAIRYGRKFVGIDANKEYLDISKRRLEKVAADAEE